MQDSNRSIGRETRGARLSPLFTWRSAIADSKLPPLSRLVALALSLHMNERGGSCMPSTQTLADETGLGRATVGRHINVLVETGWLIRTKPGGGRGIATEYTASAPATETASERGSFRETASEEDSLGSEPGDQTSLDLAETASPVRQEGVRSRAEKVQGLGLRKEGVLGETPDLLRTVNRLPVQARERALAEQILAEWNEQTGQSLRNDEWRRKIILRIREHPELEAEEHAHVIARALADPWWTGTVSPAVVYGNGGLFEKALMSAMSRNGPGKQDAAARLLAHAAELRERGL